MTHRVFITGLGCISGLGLNLESYWAGLTSGRSAISQLEGFPDDLNIRIGVVVDNLDPDNYFKTEELLLLDRFSQFALITCKEALADAGLMERSSISLQTR